jgi:hypothetical protein
VATATQMATAPSAWAAPGQVLVCVLSLTRPLVAICAFLALAVGLPCLPVRAGIRGDVAGVPARVRETRPQVVLPMKRVTAFAQRDHLC